MNPAVEIARILLERQIERMRETAESPHSPKSHDSTANTINQKGRQHADSTRRRRSGQTEGRR
ncbi:MAG: hypothetical protein KDJ52_30060 [Anaerolineae bacterium]|nr:hypothetical protein [Anaerolineae bacterium]